MGHLSSWGPPASPCEKASIIACPLRPCCALALPMVWLCKLSFNYMRCFVILLRISPASAGLSLCNLHFCHLPPKGAC